MNHDDIRRRSSGLPELDQLLGGGIDIRIGSTTSLLIAGEPGAGKSTLGMQIACHSLKSAESILIVLLEEKPSDADYLAKSFSLIPQGTQKIYDPDITDFPSRECHQFTANCATICFSFFPYGLSTGAEDNTSPIDGVVSLFNFIKKRLKYLEELHSEGKIPRVCTILVDSLPSVSDRSVSALQRGLFKSLCELTSLGDSLIILAAEQQNEGDWRDFVADIVIHLGWGADSVSGEMRFLRLLKTRGQDSWDGRHPYRILPTMGIFISPRTAEVLRRQRILNRRMNPELLKFSVDSSLNHLLHDRFMPESGIWSFSDSSDTPGEVFAGTSVLLYGEDETRKNLVAVRFLQAVGSDSGKSSQHEVGRPKGLLISCGTSVRSAAELLRSFWLHSDIRSNCDDIIIIEGPMLFENIDEFISRVRKAIESSGGNVTRAAVDDVGAMVRDEYYSGPLRELLSAYGVASLFVHTVDANSDDGSREQFDTVIRTRHLVLPTGQSRVAYRVVKLRGLSPLHAKSMECYCPRPNGRIDLKNSFAFYEELPDGLLKTVPWHLRLYFPSDDQASYWANEVTSLFSSVYTGSDAPNVQPFGRNDADSVFQAVIDLPEDYPLAATELINFDDYWCGQLANRRRLVPLLDILNSGDDVSLDEFSSAFPKWVWETAPKCPDRDQVVGVPHHLDFGIYTVRRDLLVDAGISLERYVNSENGLLQFTWSQMCDLSRVVAERFRSRPDRVEMAARIAAKVPFGESRDARCLPEDLPQFKAFRTSANGIDESFFCFLLEVLRPFCSNRTWDIKLGSVFATPEFQQALYSFTKHLIELAWRPPQEADHSHREEYRSPPASEATLFERHWFVSLWWQFRKDPKLRDKVLIMHPPILESALDARSAASCRGHWFLGVVSGSTDFRRAAAAIKTLTSEVACGNLFRKEMGMPPLESLLSAATFFGQRMGVLQKVYFERSFSRAEIVGYHDIRTTCTIRFRDFLSRCCSQQMSDQELFAECESMTTSLDEALVSLMSKRP